MTPGEFDTLKNLASDWEEHARVLGEPRDKSWFAAASELRDAAEQLRDAAPTRTRPGDQVLPDGDESIPDDQSLIIADLEERRQLGISRYGQGHRPFNGRNTLVDLYEEQLDLLVYLRSIRRASEATRNELVSIVARALEKAPLTDVGPAAEVAVDRIMSWVTSQIIIGQEPVQQPFGTSILPCWDDMTGPEQQAVRDQEAAQ